MTPYKKQQNIWSEQAALYIVYELDEKSIKKKNEDSVRFNEIRSKNQFTNINFGGRSLYKGNSDSSGEVSSDETNEYELPEIFEKSDSGFWILVEDKSKKNSGVRSLPFSKKKKVTANCEIKKYFPEIESCSEQIFQKFENEYRSVKTVEKGSASWIDAEEICEAGNKRKWDISEDQLRNLRMFCTKPKEES